LQINPEIGNGFRVDAFRRRAVSPIRVKPGHHHRQSLLKTAIAADPPIAASRSGA
jgi:hypothetical protein